MAGKVAAVIPAAGSGTRMGGAAKQFMPLAGLPMLARVCLTIQAAPCVDALVVAVPPGEEERTRELLLSHGCAKLARVVAGGQERQDSVAAGCVAARELGAEWVLVHDAARPLATPDLFARVLAAAREASAAIAAFPCFDTVKQEDGSGLVARTVDRNGLWLVQTPQGFSLDLLLEAQAAARERGLIATDEAGLMEALGREVKLVMGERHNLKVTTPEDLRLAEAWLGQAAPPVRVGQGIDVHRLVPGRPLILGGVSVPFELGLLGHSDADVLTHAVMDALLAAAGLGDIGRHFPDNDPAYAGADSLKLLARVVGMLAQQGWRAAQVSVTLVAEKPKIAPHAPKMAANLAGVLGLEISAVNVAATTTEGLGLTGRGEGMAAIATATIAPLIATTSIPARS